MSTERMVPVASLSDLADAGHDVVQEDGRAVALFHHEGEVYAVDNRCPHMGFPLSEGTVEEGVLTCHWHHARFELAAGDTFDPWADDVQTFPTEVRDGEVYLDPDPPRDVSEAVHWRNRLADGLNENLSLVMAKAVIGLDDEGEAFHTPVETAVNFGTKYRAGGWGSGLTTLGCTALLADHVGGRDTRRAMFLGVRETADDCAGEPPRFRQYAFDNPDLPKERLESWFRDSVEVRDADGAERCLLTAVACLDPTEVADIVFAAATDSLYLDSGHTLDFLNTAFATLDRIGWAGARSVPDERAGANATRERGDVSAEESNAAKVLASTVDRLTDATRSEELSSWRDPIDVAGLCFDAHDRLDDCVAAGEGRTWDEPDGFLDTLLGDDPEAIVDALTGAIREGATRTELADAVVRAATRRVAWFATNNEFGDWNTVHHTFSYANAVYEATKRADTDLLYRGCFDAAVSVYLDRFLNSPRAPTPEPGDSERDPAAIREELLDCFDRQGQVNRAADLVSEHFDAGGDPADLKRTMGRGLLREDAGFHTVQNVTWGFERFDALTARDAPDAERRLALVAPARYMAAHFPTRRSNEQTFSIATRLHRGERLHEAE
ncbi:Rieske (2Fe-2S) protein [Halosegnis marinus]|uniref:Rieske (2Fe-2S) protein n=1 Tax=Halosegnis marinus TaxID=3034023 RepID=A0ABD5ZRF7_9EURY|nr:Rieske 2Fe-2S domain-containing protein [Halosegnis sp. DT85]